LPGFGDLHRFVLLDHRPGSAFRWLQSVERPDLAFVVIDPLDFRPSYPVESVHRSLGFLKLDPGEEVVVLVVCTVPAAPAAPTANFMAPIAVGLKHRRGAQVVMHEAGYGSQDELIRDP
jgi:flagellar assembly factor FliW